MKNKLIKRKLYSEILALLDRKEIFAIVGPRQAGKTTLMEMIINHLKKEKHILPKRLFYFTFEDPLVLEEFENNAQEFVKSRLDKKITYFFFDEFHYAKDGGKKLKLLYDLFPKAKIFVSGSSSLELTFATAKHLVGRVFYFRLLPLSFAEFLEHKAPSLVKTFSQKQEWLEAFLAGKQGRSPESSVFEKRFGLFWEEFITFGGYPEVVKTTRREVKIKILENIVSTYLQKEIRTLLLIEDLAGYQKLLKILAAQSGELANFNQLSNDTGLNFPLLKKNLKILEETFVIGKIRPFYRNLASELRKSPKIYFLDSGLRNLLLENFASLAARPDKGKIGETFVFQELVKKLKTADKINFWRTRGRAEVDFVLTKGQKEIPIEVKTSYFQKIKTGRSLRNYLKSYQSKRAVVFNLNLWQVFKIGGTKILFVPIWYA